jgi:predicted GTPase
VTPSISESDRRDLVTDLRETFGLIGAPVRLSMRAGSKNPYASKERWE